MENTANVTLLSSLISKPDEFASLITKKRYERKQDAAVFILSSQSYEQLCPFLRGFNDRFVVTNPSDVFLFFMHDDPGQHNKLAACLDRLPGFYTINMRAHESALGWVAPHHVRDRKLWTGHWTEQYRIMGHWRLIFQFRLAQILGYDYLLQVDDDSKFPETVQDNLFRIMATENLKIAGRAAFPDAIHVTIGLPELARYFLVTENHQPSPLLFTHCNPRSLEGLLSDVNRTGIGWDRTAFYGNFIIFSVRFMHEEMVKRFINLVERSGGHFMYRWNEQATLGMIWQMFVREKEFRIFNFPYQHQRFQRLG